MGHVVILPAKRLSMAMILADAPAINRAPLA